MTSLFVPVLHNNQYVSILFSATSAPGTMNFAAPSTAPAASSVTATTSANAPSLFGATKSTAAPATLTIGTGQISAGAAAPVSLSTATT